MTQHELGPAPSCRRERLEHPSRVVLSGLAGGLMPSGCAVQTSYSKQDQLSPAPAEEPSSFPHPTQASRQGRKELASKTSVSPSPICVEPSLKTLAVLFWSRAELPGWKQDIAGNESSDSPGSSAGRGTDCSHPPGGCQWPPRSGCRSKWLCRPVPPGCSGDRPCSCSAAWQTFTPFPPAAGKQTQATADIPQHPPLPAMPEPWRWWCSWPGSSAGPTAPGHGR